MSRPLDLIILDCDGVLFDSRPANVAFHNAVLAEIDQPPLDAEGEDLGHYLAADQLYIRLFGEGSALHQRARATARAMDYSPFYDLMVPAPGLFSTLEGLRKAHKLAMASNRSHTAQGVAERFDLDRHLDLVVGTAQVERPKPAPDMLLLCLRELGVDAEATVFVGDAMSDRDAAGAANIEFIGVGPACGVADPINHIGELIERIERRSDK